MAIFNFWDQGCDDEKLINLFDAIDLQYHLVFREWSSICSVF